MITGNISNGPQSGIQKKFDRKGQISGSQSTQSTLFAGRTMLTPPQFSGEAEAPKGSGKNLPVVAKTSDPKVIERRETPEPFHIPSTRKAFMIGAPATAVAIGVAGAFFPPLWGLYGLWAPLAGVGLHDVTQKKHALLRNYPILGHLRFIMEGTRPELRQYLVENDTDELPLSREQRTLVYARSKGQNDKQALGTLHNLYAPGAEWMLHTGMPTNVTEEPRITIGGPDCKQPYNASVFNTSAMSFGSLSPQAVMALAKGAYLDNFFMSTGEGGLSPFHLGFDVDIEDPNFDYDKIIQMAKQPMTEEETAAARKDGTPGIISKGLSKLLPLSEAEQLEAIQAGQDEALRSRIEEEIDQLPVGQLNSLKLPKSVAVQLVFESVKMGEKLGAGQRVTQEEAEVLYPVAAKIIQERMHETTAMRAATQEKVNEELLTRGIGRLFRVKQTEKLKTGAAGKIIKGTAEKLRLNTMQFSRFPSGDIVWNIGSGYFGCRTPDGKFDPKKFEERAQLPQVKMIELKLSQGAKPGKGGILPGAKVSPGIAKLRGVTPGEDCISPKSHNAFSTPRELLQFIKKMRDLSGGKPVGFKLCLGQRHEFLALCKAMRETGITPDFITVDGAEGGTGSSTHEATNNVGVPLKDALVFINNALIGTGLRDRITLISAGKVVSGYDIIANMARGADSCNAARSMMLSIGCIMARLCHTNQCPVGVATQDPELTQGLNPDDKGLRNASYHRETIKEVKDLLGMAGLSNTRDVHPDLLEHRVSPSETRRFSELYPQLTLKPGALLDRSASEEWQKLWNQANPDSFRPNQTETKDAEPV